MGVMCRVLTSDIWMEMKDITMSIREIRAMDSQGMLMEKSRR